MLAQMLVVWNRCIWAIFLWRMTSLYGRLNFGILTPQRLSFWIQHLASWIQRLDFRILTSQSLDFTILTSQRLDFCIQWLGFRILEKCETCFKNNRSMVYLSHILGRNGLSESLFENPNLLSLATSLPYTMSTSTRTQHKHKHTYATWTQANIHNMNTSTANDAIVQFQLDRKEQDLSIQMNNLVQEKLIISLGIQ